MGGVGVRTRQTDVHWVKVAVGQESIAGAAAGVGAGVVHVASGVAASDGVVAGVVVSGQLPWVRCFQDGVDADEASASGVVFAGAEVFQTGCRVAGAADIALVAGPGGGRGASGLAEGGVLAAGDGLGLVVDGEGVGSLAVRDEVLDVAGVGAFGDGGAADGVVAGRGEGLVGGCFVDLGVADEEGGLAGVGAQDQVA